MKWQCISYVLLPNKSPYNLVVEIIIILSYLYWSLLGGWELKGYWGDSGLASLTRSQSKDFFLLLYGAFSGKIETTLSPSGFSIWFPSPGRLRAAGLLT